MSKSKIEYVNNTCDDLMVVNAARVSFNKHSTALSAGDEKLINYLASHGHWTPFSHCRITFESDYPELLELAHLYNEPELLSGMVWNQDVSRVRHSLYGWARLLDAGVIHVDESFAICKILHEKFPISAKALGISGVTLNNKHSTVRVVEQSDETRIGFIDCTMREKVPIFVARQRFKHMVGVTYNEVSRRYVDDTPEFYMPDVWRSRPDKSIKQGSSDVPADMVLVKQDTPDAQPFGIDLVAWHEGFIDESVELYGSMLEADVAPEQARMVLPQSMFTEYYVTCSLNTWNRTYKQRIDPHAQKEIRDIAVDWDNILTENFKDFWSYIKNKD